MKLTMVGTVQFNHIASDKQRNLDTIHSFVRTAQGSGARLVVFPEMCITGYWHVRNLSENEVGLLSEAVPDGPSTQRLLQWAKDYEMAIGAGLIERSDDGMIYNTYVIAMPDGRHAAHRKLHCFISEHMRSGDSYTIFDFDGTRYGILICWDNNLVENARATALLGAEVLLAPHQTGGCDSRSPDAMGLIDPVLWLNRSQDPEAIRAEFQGPKGRAWLMRWLPARAHDNGIFVVFSNGIGIDDDEVRTGNAMVIDPYGKIIAESTSVDDDIVITSLDPARLDRCTGQRWIRGRRPELYGPLTQPTASFDPREARFSTEPTAASESTQRTRS